MSALLIALAAFVGYIVAYNTYGRWLGKKIFRLSGEAAVPSETLRDDKDYVPTNRWVLFGHHFTSIAGTGPIVGPAIAVLWGWLPALLWVVFGSIFIGAVHDMTALVLSTRHKGNTIGEVAGDMISPRARFLFLLVLGFALMLVIAVFGLVIATVFDNYPASVLPVWLTLPIAIFIGFAVNRRGKGLLIPTLGALALIYAAIWLGCYYLQLSLPENISFLPEGWGTPVVVWTIILLIYCYIASVLPVWTLLQPRDYINSFELFIAMGVLIAGLFVAAFTGTADLFGSAPAVATSEHVPADAPPIWPFLFITVACGAISGFHSLVSSGTSSKQLANEKDASMIGYGSMLMEGALAVLVILSCCAGLGMGLDVDLQVPVANPTAEQLAAADGEPVMETKTEHLTGQAAWESRYKGKAWADFKLGPKVAAFVDGGGNFIAATGIPKELALGLVAVLVASFAATTLDTATRLQRYIVQEIATTCRMKPLANKYVATAIAVISGGVLALMPVTPGGPLGKGGTILWPLFGTVNQLVAGLALMVGVFYLLRNRVKPIVLAVPMVIMLILPAWAMLWTLFHDGGWWFAEDKRHLLTIGVIILVFEAWIIVEGALAWRRIRAERTLDDADPEDDLQQDEAA